MSESGRTCACTPRSLLVPAGGVRTLDPSQRVSAKELAARDREWQRQRQTTDRNAPQAPTSMTQPATKGSPVGRDSEATPAGHSSMSRKKPSPFSMFGRRDTSGSSA